MVASGIKKSKINGIFDVLLIQKRQINEQRKRCQIKGAKTYT